MLPFPSQEMVGAAADAVLRLMEAHPHIYSHSLRYLPRRSRKRFAETVARQVLYTAWLKPDHDSVLNVSRQMATMCEMLIEAGRGARPGRWCPECQRCVETTYRRMALHCRGCDTVTRPYNPQRQLS